MLQLTCRKTDYRMYRMIEKTLTVHFIRNTRMEGKKRDVCEIV